MYFYDNDEESDRGRANSGRFGASRPPMLAGFYGNTASYMAGPADATSDPSPTTMPSRPARPLLTLDEFGFNKPSLEAGHIEKVRELATHVIRSWRSPLPIRRILLVGHTDDVGDDKYNLDLGLQRAESVLAQLATDIEDLRRKGLAKGADTRISIDAETRGKKEPVTADRAKRELNRRVEIFFFVTRTKPVPPPPVKPVPPHQYPIIIPPIVVPKPPEPGIPWPHWTPRPPTPWNPWPWRPKGAPPPPPPKDNGKGSGIADWIKTSLTAAAGALGIVISGGMWALRKETVQKAIDAAWLVFQLEEAPLKTLIGLAGEAALEAILPDVFGLDPKQVFNLNKLAPSFPVLDLISPRGVISVKTYGIVSTLVGKDLESSILSKYKGDFLEMVLGGPGADSKLDKCARYLFENQQALRQQGVWPTALRGTSEQQIRNYVQREGLLVIPNDHVQMVRKEIGKHLNGLRLSKTIQADPKWIQDQVFRIQPGGVKSTDLGGILEVTRDLPKEQNERLYREHGQLIRQRRARQGRK